MTEPLSISASIDIHADPSVVWELISDVRRMSEWSPECRKVWVLGRRRQGRGIRLLGLNRRGWAVWPTLSQVVRFEPPRALAWRTRESGAVWSYEVLPDEAGGTVLTGRRELSAYTAGTRLLAPVIGGAAGHDEELAAGVRTTLARIKATVEREPVIG